MSYHCGFCASAVDDDWCSPRCDQPWTGTRAACRLCDQDVEFYGSFPPGDVGNKIGIDQGEGWMDRGGNFHGGDGHAHNSVDPEFERILAEEQEIERQTREIHQAVNNRSENPLIRDALNLAATLEGRHAPLAEMVKALRGKVHDDVLYDAFSEAAKKENLS